MSLIMQETRVEQNNCIDRNKVITDARNDVPLFRPLRHPIRRLHAEIVDGEKDIDEKGGTHMIPMGTEENEKMII
jgi:hypothetical protein